MSSPAASPQPDIAPQAPPAAAPAAAPSPLDPPPGDEHARERRGNRRLVILGVVAALIVGGVFAYRKLTVGHERTDDAQIEADVVPLAVRVGGQVAAVRVADNTHVEAGQVLLELDRAELTARVDAAKAELAAAHAQADAAEAHARIVAAGAQGGLSTARAQVSTSQAQARSADAQVTAARAQVARATADQRKTALDLERAKNLAAQGAVTQERLDAAQAAADATTAQLGAAQAQLVAAEGARAAAQGKVAEARGNADAAAPVDARVAEADAQAKLARARIDTATAALAQAELALSYATVVAPAAGTVSNLNIRAGQLVVPGQQIAVIVPEATYVVANFKETQIGGMHAGQQVDVEVDAFPGRTLHGTVESLAGGTGSRFSLLPPDNASGNFVKVVQRVRVRITWREVPRNVPLRAGMSAEVTVHTAS